MINLYYLSVRAGNRTIDNVPEKYRAEDVRRRTITLTLFAYPELYGIMITGNQKSKGG